MYLDGKSIIHKKYCVDMLAITTLSTLTKTNRAWTAHEVATPIAPNVLHGQGPRVNLRANAYNLFTYKVGSSRLPFGVWEAGAVFHEEEGVPVEKQMFAFTGLYPRDTKVNYAEELFDPLGDIICYLSGCEEWEVYPNGDIVMLPFDDDEDAIKVGHVRKHDDFDDNNFVLEVEVNLTEIITLWEDI